MKAQSLIALLELGLLTAPCPLPRFFDLRGGHVLRHEASTLPGALPLGIDPRGRSQGNRQGNDGRDRC